ncbi:MAG TPA: hypothetical protein VHY30_04460 [Verrucomicrobiae bacterium]|nr:hypothetical protein [Verrucomicrobiae bacterium]
MSRRPDKLAVTKSQIAVLLFGYFDRHNGHRVPGLWPAACTAMGWDKNDKAFRLQKIGEIIEREISSTKEIGRIKEFTAVKGRLLAWSQPANLAAQMNIVEQPLIVLRFGIRKMADEAYWKKIARDQFGTDDLDSLAEWKLVWLRNTLAERAVGEIAVEPESDLAGEEEHEPTPEEEGVPF